MSTVTRPWRELVALSADEGHCRLGVYLLRPQLQDHSANLTWTHVCPTHTPTYCRTNRSHVWPWAAPCRPPTTIGPCCCCCLQLLLPPSGRVPLGKQKHPDAPRPEASQQHLSKGSPARRPQVAREMGLAGWCETWSYYVSRSCSVIVESIRDCVSFPFFIHLKEQM